MNPWAELEAELLGHLRKRGELPPEAETRVLEEFRSILESLVDATLKAQYGPVKADRDLFSIAEVVKTAEGLMKELPSKVEAIARAVGPVLWWVASQRKLGEVAVALDMLDATEAFNPLHLKVLDAYIAAMPTDGVPPTIPGLRAEFLLLYGESLLPKGFSLYKMVDKTLKLPIGKATRGRPIIRNPRR